MPLDQADIEAIRELIRAELAPIERKLDVLPHVRFLESDDTARQVIEALRYAKANTRQNPDERYPVPQR